MNQEQVLTPPIKNKYNLIFRIFKSLFDMLSNISFRSRCCYESECNSKPKPN